MRDTFKVFFVLEPGDLDNWARTLSLPIASKSYLTFSSLELTHVVLFSKQICYDLSTVAINALKESVLLVFHVLSSRVW